MIAPEITLASAYLKKDIPVHPEPLDTTTQASYQPTQGTKRKSPVLEDSGADTDTIIRPKAVKSFVSEHTLRELWDELPTAAGPSSHVDDAVAPMPTASSEDKSHIDLREREITAALQHQSISLPELRMLARDSANVADPIRRHEIREAIFLAADGDVSTIKTLASTMPDYEHHQDFLRDEFQMLSASANDLPTLRQLIKIPPNLKGEHGIDEATVRTQRRFTAALAAEQDDHATLTLIRSLDKVPDATPAGTPSPLPQTEAVEPSSFGENLSIVDRLELLRLPIDPSDATCRNIAKHMAQSAWQITDDIDRADLIDAIGTRHATSGTEDFEGVWQPLIHAANCLPEQLRHEVRVTLITNAAEDPKALLELATSLPSLEKHKNAEVFALRDSLLLNQEMCDFSKRPEQQEALETVETILAYI